MARYKALGPDSMSSWKDLAAQVAPALAGALGGPLAKKAVGTLLDVFGVSDEKELEAAILAASPEQLLAAKKADYDFKLAYLTAEITDKADARALQVAALQQSDIPSKRFLYNLSWFWSVASASYIAFITFFQIPEANIRFADTILGFLLGTIIASIFQFFYGSSFGSRQKDERKL